MTPRSERRGERIETSVVGHPARPQQPPRALVRAPRSRRPIELALDLPPLLRFRAPRDRRLGLDVAEARLRCRTSTDRDGGNGDLALDVSLQDRQRVADLHVAGGLRPLAVHAHVPAFHGVSRKTARLEKAGAPEPAVYA